MLSLKYEIIKNLVKEIDNNLVKYIGEKIDLKLHDLDMYVYENPKEYNYNDFEDYCIFSYNNFEDYLKDKYIKLDYIGTSSKFYITTNWLYKYYEKNSYCNTSTLEKKIMLINEFMNFEYNITLANEFYISFLPHSIKQSNLEIDIEIRDYFDNLNDKEIIIEIVSQFKKCFLEDLQNIKECYEYIQNFKDNSIEDFKEFCNIE